MNSHPELVAHAAQLRPLLESNVARTESARRIAEENMQALENAGLMDLLIPRRFGGQGASMETALCVSAELAKACPSTSWVQTLMNVSAWFATRASHRLQQDIFGNDGRPRLCGSLEPNRIIEPVEGGFLITGRWDFTSGCWHANWCICGVPILNPQGQPVEAGWAFVPMSELKIEDTWYAAGMRGTGSNTVAAERLFVPAHRVMSLRGEHVDEDWEARFVPEPCDLWPLKPVLVLILIGPILGIAEAALEKVLKDTHSRGIKYTVYRRRSDSAVVQHELARAAMLVDTARMHILRAATDVDNAASGIEMDYLTRTRVRADCGAASQAARDAVELLLSISGGSAFKDSNPLQRFWRDIGVASRHSALTTTTNFEIYGRALLGLPDNITTVV